VWNLFAKYLERVITHPKRSGHPLSERVTSCRRGDVNPLGAGLLALFGSRRRVLKIGFLKTRGPQMTPCGKRSKPHPNWYLIPVERFVQTETGWNDWGDACATCQGQAPSSCRSWLKSSGTRLFTQRTLTRQQSPKIYRDY